MLSHRKKYVCAVTYGFWRKVDLLAHIGGSGELCSMSATSSDR